LREEEIDFSEADIAANLEYVQHRITVELVISVFGTGEAYKLEATADPQIQKAIELLPQAESLLNNARQVIAQRERQ